MIQVWQAHEAHVYMCPRVFAGRNSQSAKLRKEREREDCQPSESSEGTRRRGSRSRKPDNSGKQAAAVHTRVAANLLIFTQRKNIADLCKVILREN